MFSADSRLVAMLDLEPRLIDVVTGAVWALPLEAFLGRREANASKRAKPVSLPPFSPDGRRFASPCPWAASTSTTCLPVSASIISRAIPAGRSPAGLRPTGGNRQRQRRYLDPALGPGPTRKPGSWTRRGSTSSGRHSHPTMPGRHEAWASSAINRERRSRFSRQMLKERSRNRFGNASPSSTTRHLSSVRRRRRSWKGCVNWRHPCARR